MAMDAESRKRIDEIERQSGKPSGVGKMDRGECPLGCINTLGCFFCSYGHILHCHYPLTCDEAECGHYD